MTATLERDTALPTADPVAAWLDAHTVTGEELVIEKEALLEAYNAQGPALLPLSDRAFGQALARLRPMVKPGRRRNFGGKALAQVYLGIALGTPEPGNGPLAPDPLPSRAEVPEVIPPELPIFGPLEADERERLGYCESLCEVALRRAEESFAVAGRALDEIRRDRLYRGTHPTFEEYCVERWGFGSSRARQLIGAARTVTTVTHDHDLPAPPSERVARVLASLPADVQPAAWREAVETAPGGNVTAAHVAQVVEQRKAPEPAAPPPADGDSWGLKEIAPAAPAKPALPPRPVHMPQAPANLRPRIPSPDLDRRLDERLGRVRVMADRDGTTALRRSLALVAWCAITRGTRADRITALKVRGWDDPALVDLFAKPHTPADEPDAWPLLEELPQVELLLLAAEVLIRDEIAGAKVRRDAITPRASWYLGEDEDAESMEQSAPGGPEPEAVGPEALRYEAPLTEASLAAIPQHPYTLKPDTWIKDRKAGGVFDKAVSVAIRLPGETEERPIVAWDHRGDGISLSYHGPAPGLGVPAWELMPEGAVLCVYHLAAGGDTAAAAEIGPDPEPATWLACNDRRQPIVGSIILWFEATDGVASRARRGRVTAFEGEGDHLRLHVTGDGWSTVIPASADGLRVMPMVEQ